MLYRLLNENGNYVDNATGARRTLLVANNISAPEEELSNWLQFSNTQAAMQYYNVTFSPINAVEVTPRYTMSIPITAQASNRSLTKFQFNSRFTFEELIAITDTAKTDTVVAVLMNRFNIAETIDLDDTTVADGLGLLVLKGLLTEQRVSEILA